MIPTIAVEQYITHFFNVQLKKYIINICGVSTHL